MPAKSKVLISVLELKSLVLVLESLLASLLLILQPRKWAKENDMSTYNTANDEPRPTAV